MEMEVEVSVETEWIFFGPLAQSIPKDIHKYM